MGTLILFRSDLFPHEVQKVTATDWAWPVGLGMIHYEDTFSWSHLHAILRSCFYFILLAVLCDLWTARTFFSKRIYWSPDPYANSPRDDYISACRYLTTVVDSCGVSLCDLCAGLHSANELFWHTGSIDLAKDICRKTVSKTLNMRVDTMSHRPVGEIVLCMRQMCKVLRYF